MVVRPGDAEADLHAFFEAALGEVYPYLYRRCGVREIAEDLTQETFVTAVRALRDGGVSHLSVGWMVTTARSRFIDHCRGEARRNRHLFVVAGDGQTDLDDEVVGTEVVSELLAELPPSQRLAFVLHHLDGLKISEIAAATGATVRAVESSLARARRTLRRLASGDHDGL